MANKDQFDVNKIQYFHIRDLGFDYLIPDDVLLPQGQREAIQFSLKIVKTLGVDDKIIRLFITIELKTGGKNNKEATASYATEHLFKVENLDALIKKVGDSFEVDSILDNTITGLAYSTVRGLLYQKFSGTWFSNFILPITKPADLEESTE